MVEHFTPQEVVDTKFLQIPRAPRLIRDLILRLTADDVPGLVCIGLLHVA
jgi:hypothetical protein